MQTVKSLCIFAVMVLLAACGKQTTANSQGAAITTTFTPSPALNGCSTQHIPVDSPIGVKYVIVQGTIGTNTSINAQTGQTIEFRMPANSVWNPEIIDTAGILSELSPAGWYNSALKACIWRYAATKSGTATIHFNGSLFCPPKEQCSQIAFTSSYIITVH